MPLFRKRKTLWQIKDLKKYQNKLESHVLPDHYPHDPVHQALDKIIRSNWEKLHSIEQDFIFSWFIEYQIIEEQKKNFQMELEVINKEINIIQQKSVSKFEEINKKFQNLTLNVANLNNELTQKKQLAEDLSNAVQDQKLNGKELKKKLEERVKNMRHQVIEQQKEFERNQIKLGGQFKRRVMELDEEKLLLNEIIEENKVRISQLEKENQDLKKKNRSLKNFQEKIKYLKTIIAEIPTNILEGGGN
ncbi:MAG: hypothetical protein ACFFD2_11790 [Promethearchaeota archaeon]